MQFLSKLMRSLRSEAVGFGTHVVGYDYQVVKLCRISLAQNGSDAGVNDRILFIGGNKDDKTLPDSSRGIFLLFEEMRGGRKQDYIPH